MKIITLGTLIQFKKKIKDYFHNLLLNRSIHLMGDMSTSVKVNLLTNLDLTAVRKGCVVGCDAGTIENHWYKFANIQVNNSNTDAFISFKVTRIFGDTIEDVGILTAHVRTDGTKKFHIQYLKWELAGSSINPSRFIMAYNNTSPAICELWVYISSEYIMYHFDVIAEGNRQYRGSIWNLNNGISKNDGFASITEGFIQKASTLMIIQNPTK